tara:strand:+ start:135 stop:497 length:363 start_codon:yes stop_codon:yes gene_type:complete
MYDTKDLIWDSIIELDVATVEELRLVCSINGFNISTLESVIYSRVGYRSLKQWIECESERFVDSRTKEIYVSHLALEIMHDLDYKYKMSNTLSLDEYLYEYKNILNESEVEKINSIINLY